MQYGYEWYKQFLLPQAQVYFQRRSFNCFIVPIHYIYVH